MGPIVWIGPIRMCAPRVCSTRRLQQRAIFQWCNDFSATRPSFDDRRVESPTTISRRPDGYACLMTTLGYALSCEEFHPSELVRQAARAQQAGFEALWIFDHFHRPRKPGVRTAHAVWPNAQLPGELGQNLPTPAHFEQASSLVTTEAVAQSVPAGPDARPYLDRIKEFAAAGFDEVYVQQIGDDQEQFFAFWEPEIDPGLTA